MSCGLVAAMEEVQIFILQVAGASLRQYWFLLTSINQVLNLNYLALEIPDFKNFCKASRCFSIPQASILKRITQPLEECAALKLLNSQRLPLGKSPWETSLRSGCAKVLQPMYSP